MAIDAILVKQVPVGDLDALVLRLDLEPDPQAGRCCVTHPYAMYPMLLRRPRIYATDGDGGAVPVPDGDVGIFVNGGGWSADPLPVQHFRMSRRRESKGRKVTHHVLPFNACLEVQFHLARPVERPISIFFVFDGYGVWAKDPALEELHRLRRDNARLRDANAGLQRTVAELATDGPRGRPSETPAQLD